MSPRSPDMNKRTIGLILLTIGLFLMIVTRSSKAEEGLPLTPQGKGTDDGGESSSLYIRDMDINTLLKALTIKHNVNIISTPEVSGRISLNLKRASLEDTLTAIARIMGLTWTKEGSVYILSPEGGSGGPAAQEKASRSSQQDVQNNSKQKEEPQGEREASKSVRVFRINYADLKELSKVIQWSLEQARISAYPQEGMLLVDGTEKELKAAQHLIQSLDIPPKQALIEAQILEINLSDDLAYGIDWGATFSQGENTEGRINSPGTWLSPPPRPGDSSPQFFFGISRPHFYLKLNALEKKGNVKTLAKPRIMVLDGKPAQILIGGKLGYYLTTSTQTSTLQSVEFLDIGIQLQLTPHITEDGNILMDIHPEVSDGSLSSGLPQKTTTSVTTSIMVKAGETVFIGGLIRNSEIKARERLPLLGKIPILGALFFSKSSTQNQRKELVVLLTPQLVTAAQSIITDKEHSPSPQNHQDQNHQDSQNHQGSGPRPNKKLPEGTDNNQNTNSQGKTQEEVKDDDGSRYRENTPQPEKKPAENKKLKKSPQKLDLWLGEMT